MYETVVTVCQAHQATWASTAAFSDLHTTLAAKVDLVKALTLAQIADSRGVTATKALVLDGLVEKAGTICNVLAVYALEIGNTELLVRNLFTPSEWRRGSALARINRMQVLLGDAQANEAALLSYGVLASYLTEFEAQIAEYVTLIQQPRVAIINRKSTTLEIKRVLVELEALVSEKMDRMIRVFASTDPRFVARYKDARNIVELKGKRRPTGKDATNTDGNEE